MAKYRAYYFNGDKLVNYATILPENKSSVLETLKQSLGLNSTEKLSVELYNEQEMRYYMNSGMFLKVAKGSIVVEQHVFKKKSIRINWMNELEISKYYNEEEVEKIQQNIQAMMDFVATEEQPEFVFPHEIEERYKTVDSMEKETKIFKDVFPLEIIKGDSND